MKQFISKILKNWGALIAVLKPRIFSLFYRVLKKTLYAGFKIQLPSSFNLVPQGKIWEENLESYEKRDWRSYFVSYLNGRGIEIGPLHRPMVKHPKMDVVYIDRMTVKELREHYPELEGLPLIEPHLLSDAQTLDNLPNGEYDFVVASHIIEHMINPILALEHWCRVVKPDAMIYLVVPDKREIFDRYRPRTTIEHIILDYLRPSEDRDFSHYLDYARFVHNQELEQAVNEADRILKQNYSIHYHCFLPQDVVSLLNWFSNNVHPIKIVLGPTTSPGSDEFHLLIQVGAKLSKRTVQES